MQNIQQVAEVASEKSCRGTLAFNTEHTVVAYLVPTVLKREPFEEGWTSQLKPRYSKSWTRSRPALVSDPSDLPCEDPGTA